MACEFLKNFAFKMIGKKRQFCEEAKKDSKENYSPPTKKLKVSQNITGNQNIANLNYGENNQTENDLSQVVRGSNNLSNINNSCQFSKIAQENCNSNNEIKKIEFLQTMQGLHNVAVTNSLICLNNKTEKKTKKLDPLKLATHDVPSVFIKCGVYHVAILCGIQHVDEVMKDLDNILVYRDTMATALRTLILNKGLPFFKTIKTIKLFNQRKNVFMKLIFNIELSNPEIFDAIDSLCFMNNNVLAWNSKQLAIFIKYIHCTAIIQNQLELIIPNKILEKITKYSITGKQFINFDFIELMELVENDNKLYVTMKMIMLILSRVFKDELKHVQKY